MCNIIQKRVTLISSFPVSEYRGLLSEGDYLETVPLLQPSRPIPLLKMLMYYCYRNNLWKDLLEEISLFAFSCFALKTLGGEHIPLIRRQDVKGFVQRKPVWQKHIPTQKSRGSAHANPTARVIMKEQFLAGPHPGLRR
jgi:hypothetical protein